MLQRFSCQIQLDYFLKQKKMVLGKIKNNGEGEFMKLPHSLSLNYRAGKGIN